MQFLKLGKLLKHRTWINNHFMFYANNNNNNSNNENWLIRLLNNGFLYNIGRKSVWLDWIML